MAHEFIAMGDWIDRLFNELDRSNSLSRRVQIGSSNLNSNGNSHSGYNPFSVSPYNKVPSFPPIDVNINRDTREYEVRFALAGIDKDRVKLSFDDDMLILDISKCEKKDSPWQIIQQGIKASVSGTRKYSFPTSKYDVDKAQASWDNGILSVVVPLRKEKRPKEVAIK